MTATPTTTGALVTAADRDHGRAETPADRPSRGGAVLGEARPMVSLDELRRAWRAIQDGRFRPAPQARADRHAPLPATTVWEPAGPVVTVIGATGRCGASTTALLLATAAERDGSPRTRPGGARVVECAGPAGSSLTTAATAELGQDPPGWLAGTRAGVRLDRATGPVTDLADLPLPGRDRPDTGVTVLDIGWPVEQVLAGSGWVSAWARTASPVVVVAPGTVPGLRRLERVIAALGDRRLLAVITEVTPRAWTGGVRHSLGPLGRDLDRAGDLTLFSYDRHLAVRGVDSTTLAPSLVASAAGVLRRCGCERNPVEGTA